MCLLVLRGESRRFRGIGQRPHDCEAKFARGQRPDGDMTAASQCPIGVEQLVATDRFDRIRRARHQVIRGVGIVPSPERFGIGLEGEPAISRVGEYPSFVLEVALAQDEVSEHQEPARRAIDRDPPLHRGIVAGSDGAHRDQAIAECVNPPAVGESHLERRGNGQQTPAGSGVDQHPQATGPHDVVRIPRNREQLVERRVADGELRGEDAVHPARRA